LYDDGVGHSVGHVIVIENVREIAGDQPAVFGMQRLSGAHVASDGVMTGMLGSPDEEPSAPTIASPLEPLLPLVPLEPLLPPSPFAFPPTPRSLAPVSALQAASPASAQTSTLTRRRRILAA
jgi:hypothetical protein